MKSIEIIIPLYNEQNNIVPLYQELIKELSALNYQFRFFFIDDGSYDDSFKVIQSLAKQDSRVSSLSFSKNFGKEMAVTAGIMHSVADAVIIMDADLQHPPKTIHKFIEQWELGFEIIVSVRHYLIKQPIWKRVGSYLFNKIFQLISDTETHIGASDFRLLDKKVVRALKPFTERNRMVRGLIDWLGFKRTTVEYVAQPRYSGHSSYSFTKLTSLAINSFTSFSLLPLKIIGSLGIFFFFVFGGLLSFMIFDRLTTNKFGFTNLAMIVAVNSFSMGLVMIGIGLIALYICHIHTESMNRPHYVIDKTLNVKIENVSDFLE